MNCELCRGYANACLDFPGAMAVDSSVTLLCFYHIPHRVVH